MTKKRKRAGPGQPSRYTKAAAARICDLIIEGKTLRQIAATEGMPSIPSIYRWMEAHPEFREQYARAKDIQTEILVDEIRTIAFDGSMDVEEREDRNGNTYEVTRQDVVQRSKLMVDAIKWQASKLKPKKYGDKLDLNHSGKVETSTPTLRISSTVPKPDGK